MGFDFGQFLGGMSRQISENIEDAKKFNREKDFRLEMLAEEEATKNRLAKSAERRQKAEELEELTATLAGYFGADNAAATVKTLGVGASKDLLKTAQNFDHTTGDFATAFKFPEIKNGTFGNDLVTAGGDADDITKTIPITLTDIYKPEKKTEDKVIDTEVKFKLLMSDNQIEINQMPTVTEAQKEAKDAAQAEWDRQMEAYTKVLNMTEDAKREGKPKKGDNEYYSDTQINDMLEKSFEVEFSNATGFAGAREEYKQSLTGSNTIPYARVMGLISEQTINLDFRNDINLTNEATARYKVAKDDLKSFAKSKTSALMTEIENNNGLTDELKSDDNIAKPTAIMDAVDFMSAAKDGSLQRQGIYLIKNPVDRSLTVVTFLGKDNPFDSKKRNYLIHRTVKDFSIDAFNNIEPQSFGG
tara:strand:+ start:440 stop:1687 length:1248 start_codon:yes stop_codon:yes gene_type:complete